MAYSKDKVRITLAVPIDVDERLEKLANRLATSKSKMCAQLVIEGIDNYERAWELMNNPELREKFMEFVDIDNKR